MPPAPRRAARPCGRNPGSPGGECRVLCPNPPYGPPPEEETMNRQAPVGHRPANVTRDDPQPTVGAPAPPPLRAPGCTGWPTSATLPACLVAAAMGAAIATGAGTLPRLYWISLYAKLVRAGVSRAQNVDDGSSLVDSRNDGQAER